MTDNAWSRLDGMVIAPNLDPMEFAKELQSQSVVAQISWFDDSPSLVGIRVATEDEEVATLGKRAKYLKRGPKLSELVEGLAKKFGAEIMIGDVSYDAIPEGGDTQSLHELSVKTSEEPVRLVEIGRTPASAVPLLAAFEGADIAEMELPDGKRLLAAQLPSHRDEWYFGEAPLVTLTVKGNNFQAVFMDRDDPEHMVNHNWGMNRVTIAGGRGWKHSIPEEVDELVGTRPHIRAIAQEVPGADLGAAFAASTLTGTEAVAEFVEALGLHPHVADFLVSRRNVGEIENAVVHEARGISNAIGRSVDIIIDERNEGSRFWDGYTNLVVGKRWVVPAITAVEAAAGFALLYLSRKRDGRRSGWAKLGTVISAFILTDSVAQNALAKYTVGRVERRNRPPKARPLNH